MIRVTCFSLFIFLLLGLISCHTPYDPDAEKVLAEVQSVIFGGADVEIRGISKDLEELKWFCDTLKLSAINRLKASKSFSLFESIDSAYLKTVTAEIDSLTNSLNTNSYVLAFRNEKKSLDSTQIDSLANLLKSFNSSISEYDLDSLVHIIRQSATIKGSIKMEMIADKFEQLEVSIKSAKLESLANEVKKLTHSSNLEEMDRVRRSLIALDSLLPSQYFHGLTSNSPVDSSMELVHVDSLLISLETSDTTYNSILVQKLPIGAVKSIQKRFRTINEKHAILFLKYRISDYWVRSKLVVDNRAIGILLLPSGGAYIFSDVGSRQYGLIDLQTSESTKNLAEDLIRFTLMAPISESNWIYLLDKAKNKEKAPLPNPTLEVINKLEHKIGIARGTEQLTWWETARTADWSKPGQWGAAWRAFLLGMGILLIAGIAGKMAEKGCGGAILAVVAWIIGMYFLYLSLAAIF